MVNRVEIIKSTGDGQLDGSYVRTYKHWKFKPGVLPKDFKLAIPTNS